jgi:hypothetical protein
MTEKWIHFQNLKIQNPAFEAEIVYNGNIDNYDFKHQTTNYLILKDVLAKYNITLSNIIVGTYKAECHTSLYLTKFIAYNDDKNVIWYKYEGKRSGGGNNHLILLKNGDKLKIKVTDIVNNVDNTHEKIENWLISS